MPSCICSWRFERAPLLRCHSFVSVQASIYRSLHRINFHSCRSHFQKSSPMILAASTYASLEVLLFNDLIVPTTCFIRDSRILSHDIRPAGRKIKNFGRDEDITTSTRTTCLDTYEIKVYFPKFSATSGKQFLMLPPSVSLRIQDFHPANVQHIKRIWTFANVPRTSGGFWMFSRASTFCAGSAVMDSNTLTRDMFDAIP